ncbi:leptin receptor gene-related protein-like [Corticium candelabrum]|uniref:leptin receptor gene-related protein-like n=1 Tax=Corticium candelabrum TaxID=121492 RepID=UPI002E25EA59|nr:leptin receptor gene-related protein-like [Corticium candelabrum]
MHTGKQASKFFSILCICVIRVVSLAFFGACGALLVVLGCALPEFGSWWPLFVLLPYVLAPIPITVVNRTTERSATSSVSYEVAVFLTTGIVMSAFGIPAVLTHVNKISTGAMALTIGGNIFVFLTLFLYFNVFTSDDDDFAWGIV